MPPMRCSTMAIKEPSCLPSSSWPFNTSGKSSDSFRDSGESSDPYMIGKPLFPSAPNSLIGKPLVLSVELPKGQCLFLLEEVIVWEEKAIFHELMRQIGSEIISGHILLDHVYINSVQA